MEPAYRRMCASHRGYLNWRYREHPTQSYEMLAARQGDKLRGYLILHMKGEDCTIDDLLAEDDAARVFSCPKPLP